jgi:uncharacterized protein
MTRIETNRRIATDAFDAWRHGTSPITSIFAPEMTWTIAGRSLASRSYASRQEFIDEVLAPFAARFPADAPFRPVAVRGVYADGDTVVVVWDGHGVATDGKPYDNTYAWFMTMRDGLVVDGTAFFDSIAFDELWTRVTP